ncbi:hypothetical protein [Rhizobium mongolense]|nr:hypothetical protein [Rhizobium mongolense]
MSYEALIVSTGPYPAALGVPANEEEPKQGGCGVGWWMLPGCRFGAGQV